MSVSTPADGLHFSTDAYPEWDRVAVWREVFGRHMVRAQYERLPERDFFHRATLRSLPGVSLMFGAGAGFRSSRTSELIADGCDDLVFAVNTEGVAFAAQHGREAEIRPYEGVLLDTSDRCSITFPAPARFQAFRLPRSMLTSLLSDVGANVSRRLPQSEALRLLTSYLTSLDRQALAAPDLRLTVAAHLRDLIALAIGPTRDARVLAEAGGLQATRLAALKADILAHLADEGLSVVTLARRHRVTPRYVQMLFESQGGTFSGYVLEQRLARAYQLVISDTGPAMRTISAIAFHVGFSNLSYFNRCFRRRYGMTPSDLRNATGSKS
jgi:AraC-like DNA-binding protein